ncbi:hypothetical protein F6U93_09970 [Tamlana haliotis]|uniref:Uncharacterized protein n=1 Tax=Pseudotamlana haliotis TaxID=2614804 RepID=A0A6N6MHF9_9FLAO|nr:hypothetical protein [Tamlana haliotis]KAB1067602.1 hypothetical protein F6U93_09970 [Tamlana haliotis]
MYNNLEINQPEGVSSLENLYKDLLSIKANDLLSSKIIDNLIAKVKVIIEIYRCKPRLPLYDIEKAIIELCKADKSIQGVTVKILFVSKFQNIDTSKLGLIKVNV